MKTIKLVIEQDAEETRIDSYLSKETNFSRTQIQKLIDSGNILVNNNTIKKKYS